MTHPADRPATEPRTEAEWTWLNDDYRAGTVFITDDPTGAQGAIAEGLRETVADRIVNAHNAVVRSLAEAAQGAAPLTEGLPSVEALALAMTACGISDGDGDPMPDVAAAILTRLGAAPRAEGPCGECGHRATTHGCYQTECGCLGWAAPLDLDAIWEHVRVSHGCTHDIFRIGIVGNIPFEGAAPLGAVGAVLQEMDINEATLGTPVIYRSDLLAILEGAAPSEGAAPRAEGLDVERLATIYYAATGQYLAGSPDQWKWIATEYARLSRPSDEREDTDNG